MPEVTLVQARQHHAAGQLPHAIAAYLTLLHAQPNNAEVWHLLGVATSQTGRPDLAGESIRRAIALKPNVAEFHNDLGLVCRAMKDLAEAVTCYQRALALKPDFAEAHHNLANVSRELGDLDRAISSYRRAIEIRPDYASAHQNLANILKDLRRWDDAAESYQRVMELQPAHAPAHAGLGNVRKEQGRCAEAMSSYRRALELGPDDAAVRNNLGTLLQACGQAEEAIECYRRALNLSPGYAVAHNNLGSALVDLGRNEEALAHFRRALELDRSFTEACHNMGNALKELNRREEAVAYYRRMLTLTPNCADTLIAAAAGLAALELLDEAVACYTSALELRPDSAVALYGLGNALKDQRNFTEAADRYRQALRIRPEFAEALNNLGLVLAELGNLEESARLCRQALELHPEFAGAQYNLGNALKRQNRLQEAIACYREALEKKPDFTEALINLGYALIEQAIFKAANGHVDLSEARACYERALISNEASAEIRVMLALLKLLEGNFEQGWQQYEWRWKGKNVEPRIFSQPAWQGELFPGKTLLLHAEQGYGDTIQFARYAAVAKALGGRVILLCPKELVGLLSRCPGVDHCCCTSDPPPVFDLQAPLMSVARIVKTTLATIPATNPYVFVAESALERWSKYLGRWDGLRVGIVWQGNPKHQRDRFRSVPLACFEPLAAVPGVHLFSLQKGAGCEQLAQTRIPIQDLGEHLGDFVDAAAACRNLDLVIGCDTAVIHLAGALGCPVWTALATIPDWRWLLRRPESPWYPTMRLFRQTDPGSWSTVFARMAAELQQMSRRKHEEKTYTT